MASFFIENNYTKMKRILLVCYLLMLSHWISAQAPTGYYSGTENLSGENLKAQLHQIIKAHTTFPYSSSSTDVWDILKVADRDPANPENVILIYKGNSVNAAQEYNNGAGWNREHVWAKSHGDFGETPPAGTDLHHLRASDISVNADRGNKDFDNGGTQHSEATGCYYTSTTWEPRDEVKGDIARMMFYMATRYEGSVSGEPDLELVDYISGSTTEPIFGKLSTLLLWHEQDPVDDVERTRNDVVYSYQNNRNPFIDHPEFACLIWGSQCNESVENPVISPQGGTYSGAQTITITCSTEGASIYYSLDNALPDANANLYTSPFLLSESLSVKAIAIKEGMVSSDVVTANYVISGSSVSLNENFENLDVNSDFNLPNWLAVVEKGSKNWKGVSYNSNTYVQVSAYNSGDTENVAWLITPLIDLSGYQYPAFSFRSKDGYNNGNPMKLMISENVDTGDPLASDWVVLDAVFSNVAPSNSYASDFMESGNIDLSAYSNKSVRLAFVYSGGSTSITTTMQIDDVSILENEVNHAPEISEVSYSPLDPELNDEITVLCRVTDVDGNLNSVHLFYGNEELNLNNQVQLSAEGDCYSAKIRPTQAGLLYFKIRAEDQEGLSVESSSIAISVNEVIEYLFEEDFESTVSNATLSLTNWVNVAESGSKLWEAKEYQLNKYAQFSAYNSGDDSNIVWLISPEIDLQSIYNALLTFKSKDAYNNGMPMELFVTTQYEETSPSSASWDKLNAVFADGASSSSYAADFTASGNVDLSVYYGKKIYLGFKYSGGQSSITTTMQLDDVKIKGDSNLLPEIGMLEFSSENPIASESLLVSVQVSDEDGTVDEVILHYGYSETELSHQLRMEMSDGKHRAEIENLQSGVLYLSVSAKDNRGGVSFSEIESISVLTTVDNVSEYELNVYPNPFLSDLTIDHSHNLLKLELLSLDGRVLFSVYEFENNAVKLNLATLSSGLYILKFYTSEGMFMRKVLKAK